MQKRIVNLHIDIAAFLLAFLFLCLPVAAFAQSSHCGTMALIEHYQESKHHNALTKISGDSCPAHYYFDTVLVKKTTHFQIFFTPQGPHKTTEAYIDTLAKSAEYAWDLFCKNMGMRSPTGIDTTFHFKKIVEPGLYPIEVVDLDLAYSTNQSFGAACHGCYGITTFSPKEPRRSQLSIDNDFKYTPALGGTQGKILSNGQTCTYKVADQKLQNKVYGYSYADSIGKGIRITAIHELYHAIQFQYLSPLKNKTFWFEASASGTEEIGAPDVDDYHSYLPRMFQEMGKPLDKMDEDYGAGLFYIYLHNHVSQNTDKLIWLSFSEKNSEPFSSHFSKVASKMGLSADSLFHDFATRLSFSGSRASQVAPTYWIDDDEPLWPSFTQASSKLNKEPPKMSSLSYGFFSNGKLDLTSFEGSSSVVFHNGNHAEIKKINSTKTLDSIWSNLTSETDSITWVLSNFSESTPIRQDSDSTLRAYPTPWRHGNLCFSPLPMGREFLEIRTRRGDLIVREKYTDANFCLDEDRVKKLMAPGIYRFRAGSHGKTKDFLVIY